MKKFIVVGKFMLIEFRHKIYEAHNEENVRRLANADLGGNYYDFMKWEKEDYKEMNGLEITEIIEL